MNESNKISILNKKGAKKVCKNIGRVQVGDSKNSSSRTLNDIKELLSYQQVAMPQVVALSLSQKSRFLSELGTKFG